MHGSCLAEFALLSHKFVRFAIRLATPGESAPQYAHRRPVRLLRGAGPARSFSQREARCYLVDMSKVDPEERRGGKRVKASLVCVSLCGLGMIASGVFKTDVPLENGTVGYTFSGKMHAIAGLVMFLSLMVGGFMLTGVFGRDRRWRQFFRTSRLFAWALPFGFVLSLAGSLIHPPGSETSTAGVTQRIIVSLFLTWFVLIGWQMRQLDSAGSH